MTMINGQEALAHIARQASAATWPFTAISTVLFGMRTWARIQTPKAKFTWDDAVILTAWVLDICKTAFFQKAFYSANHIRSDALNQTKSTAAFWIIFTDSWVFISIAVPKLSIGLLLIQIFRPRRWLKFTILGLCTSLLILAPIGSILNLVQCSPAIAQWNSARYPNAHCWNRRVTVIYSCTAGALSAFVDLAFAVYPSVAAWQLKMSTWKKVCTSAFMSLGLASFVFAVIKLNATAALLGTNDTWKLLYHGVEIGMWNSIENDFVLGAACLPCAPPFFRACKAFVMKHNKSSSQKSPSMPPESLKGLCVSDEDSVDRSTVQVSDSKSTKTSIEKGGMVNWFDQELYSTDREESGFV